jgi:solute carrier family 45, member 1/2/4
MIAGTIGVLLGMLLLASVTELERCIGVSSQVSAILGVCTILLFVQPLQMGSRALIAEQSPPNQVSQINGWASRWTGIGSVFGYLMGALSPETSINALYAVAASWLVLSIIVTCSTVRETALPPATLSSNLAIRKISKTMKQIFKVQAFAWAGWFPFLYYGATYIVESDDLHVEASSSARGSLGMFYFALVALCFNLTLPEVLSWFEITEGVGPNVKRRKPLVIMWMAGQLSYSAVMLCCLISEGQGRVIVVSLAGFNWSVTQWAPFTLINEVMVEEDMDAGLVMSLHNVAISLPQVVSALLASGVLAFLRGLGVKDGLRILMGLSAVPSLFAAYQASCIKD